ncbi:hypothetical protein PR003_g11745 [Phytophthora rubi]|uniref:Uncharacterized protein n=1 Tax=Phytophthora rubi TaxID=129364 RepID=A0A6A3N2T1_9STRA|nr:hypothetical protein PR002_g9487 [Phytophthora rubi]KAE9035608.1 hypothetical protein PR001_g9231 [Phytophthora rubi]KAE9337968.1 hypothetical protein PR003_g11745 [Phytophthora rubi]
MSCGTPSLIPALVMACGSQLGGRAGDLTRLALVRGLGACHRSSRRHRISTYTPHWPPVCVTSAAQ